MVVYSGFLLVWVVLPSVAAGAIACRIRHPLGAFFTGWFLTPVIGMFFAPLYAMALSGTWTNFSWIAFSLTVMGTFSGVWSGTAACLIVASHTTTSLVVSSK